MRLPSRCLLTKPAPCNCCRGCDALARFRPTRSARASTLRGPWASCSISSTRCSWARALATSASAARTVPAAVRLDIASRLTRYLSIDILNDFTGVKPMPGDPMPSAALAAEPLIRLSCFFGVMVLMTLWEVLTPRRPQSIRRLLRWPNNLGLGVLNTFLVRLLFPLAGVGMAFHAQTMGWGLFNIVPVPGWLAIPTAVLLLDLTIYGQHVMFHAVPFLWRLHRMHHAD